MDFAGVLKRVVGPEKIGIPKDLNDLESLVRVVLRLVFWVLTLAPLVLVPLFFFGAAMLHFPVP